MDIFRSRTQVVEQLSSILMIDTELMPFTCLTYFGE